MLPIESEVIPVHKVRLCQFELNARVLCIMPWLHFDCGPVGRESLPTIVRGVTKRVLVRRVLRMGRVAEILQCFFDEIDDVNVADDDIHPVLGC